MKFLVDKFSKPNYFRYQGRPIFLVYRPTDHPNIKQFCDALRERCTEALELEPFLIGINAHDVSIDFATLGFDSTLHFMPQLGVLPGAFVDGPSAERESANRALGVDSETVKAYSYATAVSLMREQERALKHGVIRSVFVNWDNSPRRGKDAIVLRDGEAREFRAQLDDALAMLPTDDHQLLFVNAWNEWAEGNFLEPCMETSAPDYLKELREALELFRKK